MHITILMALIGAIVFGYTFGDFLLTRESLSGGFATKVVVGLLAPFVFAIGATIILLAFFSGMMWPLMEPASGGHGRERKVGT